MNLQDFRPYIELGFKDKLSGKHFVTSPGSDGTTSTTLPQEFSYIDIPCKISFPKPELPNDEDSDSTPVKVNIELFCKFDAPIQTGDYVVASVLDKSNTVLGTYKGIIGLPKVYDTHKEVLLAVKESA